MKEDPNANISGPSSGHQQNAINIAFHWRDDNDPSLKSDFVALCDFSGDPDQYC